MSKKNKITTEHWSISEIKSDSNLRLTEVMSDSNLFYQADNIIYNLENDVNFHKNYF